MTITKDYARAMKTSFVGQETSLMIPPSELGRMIPFLGAYNFVGISSRPIEEGVDLVVVAEYDLPSVALIRTYVGRRGREFHFTWVRGVYYRGKRIRWFPENDVPGGQNRIQTVNPTPDGEGLLVSRNGQRQIWVYYPGKKGQWELHDAVMEFPKPWPPISGGMAFAVSRMGAQLSLGMGPVAQGAVGRAWRINLHPVKNTHLVKSA